MIRYKRLGYIALNVENVDRSAEFYARVVGMSPLEPVDDVQFLRCSDKHHDIALYQGPPGLRRIGFELESEREIEPLRTLLQEAGADVVDIPAADVAAMRTSAGLRTWEPVTGATLDFYVHMEGAPEAFTPSVTQIMRLGHLVLQSANPAHTVRFFTDVLNFKISDAIDDAVTFMRCFPNPLHHSFGVGDGRGQNRLHHINFMVTDIDDIGKSLWRLKELGVPIVNGPGRHLPSGSIFLYFLDPDGMTLEYSFGMEEFPELDARDPRILPRTKDSFDLWGGPVDARKGTVGAIADTREQHTAVGED